MINKTFWWYCFRCPNCKQLNWFEYKNVGVCCRYCETYISRDKLIKIMRLSDY